MVSSHTVFEMFVWAHILCGAIGLVAFWIPVMGRKGSVEHRRFGRLFINTMLLTGSFAIGISLTTLYAPTETHPHLATHALFQDPALIRGIFGWMMLYLAVLTINLAWQGKLALRNRRTHRGNRAWHNLLLQVLLSLAALNCLVQGWLVKQPIMLGIAWVGVATVATNLWFIYKPKPRPIDPIKEHIKCLVGAGISVYTAFFAFGAVRLLPELALAPGLWAMPLTVGLGLIIYHQQQVTRSALVRRASPL
jgi:hypothetical protein